MNPVLAEILRTNCVKRSDSSLAPRAYHVDGSEGAKLQELIRTGRPRVYIDRLLNVGGSIVFDDTRWYPAVRKVARYVVKHRRYAPVPSATGWRESRRRKIFNALTSIARVPGLRRIGDRLFRPEIMTPDSALGLPADNFLVFRKLADDPLGDGSNGTRRWDQRFEF